MGIDAIARKVKRVDIDCRQVCLDRSSGTFPGGSDGRSRLRRNCDNFSALVASAYQYVLDQALAVAERHVPPHKRDTRKAIAATNGATLLSFIVQLHARPIGG